MQYTICQAVAKDIDLFDRIHTENMKGYVEQVYSWNPTLFRDNFVSQDYRVIKIGNKIIGLIKIVATKDSIYLAEIQIDRQYQNKGIGTNIIIDIINEAKLSQKQLWLKLVKGNPVEKLYRRLGFVVFEETFTHKKMKKL